MLSQTRRLVVAAAALSWLGGPAAAVRSTAAVGDDSDSDEVAAAPPPVASTAGADVLVTVAEDFEREFQDRDVWVSDLVRLRPLGPDRGVGLVAAAPISNGSILMKGVLSPFTAIRSDASHAWESEDFEDFVEELGREFDVGGLPGSGRLRMKVTNLLLQLPHKSASEVTPLERYIEACTPSMGVVLQWPADARALLNGSAFYVEAEQRLWEYRRCAPSLLDAWPWPSTIPKPSLEQFIEAWVKAQALLMTRGFADAQSGIKLVPVLDVINHASHPLNNAKHGFFGNDFSEWAVHAVADIAAGDEVMISYTDSESGKTFLDMWWNYCFFDSTAVAHAAPIVVSSHDSIPSGVYWVPDASSPLEECDLFQELAYHEAQRFEVKDDDELPKDSVSNMTRQHALRAMVSVLSRHLAGYQREASSERGTAVDSLGDNLTFYRNVSRRVLRYETTLLQGALARARQALLGASPHWSEDPPEAVQVRKRQRTD